MDMKKLKSNNDMAKSQTNGAVKIGEFIPGPVFYFNSKASIFRLRFEVMNFDSPIFLYVFEKKFHFLCLILYISTIFLKRITINQNAFMLDN